MSVRIKFLGTTGEGVKPKGINRKNPGFIIEFKNSKLLIDCGEKEFLNEKPDYILLSHAHPDHINGLRYGTDYRVYLTEDTLKHIKEFPLENINIINRKILNLGEFKIEVFPVLHSVKVKTVGFRIHVNNLTITYTSDMFWLKNKEKYLNSDLVIGDGSGLKDLIRRSRVRKLPVGHASLFKIYKWSKDAGAKNVIFTNLGDWIQRIDPIFALEKIDASPVFDGSEIFLSKDEIYSIPARRPNWRSKPPKNYPKDRKDYADPLNWKYPIASRNFVYKAYLYFRKKPNQLKYSKLERNFIRKRILERWKKFGMGEIQNFNKGKEFVLQHHWRGASSHADFRFQFDNHLEGWTLADQEEKLAKELVGKNWKIIKHRGILELYWNNKLFYRIEKGSIVSKPTEKLKQEIFSFHKNLENIPELWKVDWTTGEEKKRKGTVKETAEKIWATKKALQPLSWLKVEGITTAREVEKVPGGTRFYPGIFVVVDRGIHWKGAQKPYFREFFVQGSKIKGRIVFRVVAGLKGTKKILNWLYWKPDDQTPYVLSSRAVKENWLPRGYSAMPPEWEKKVPKELQFWNKNSRKEKLITRAELVNYFIEKGIIKHRKKIKIEGKDFRKAKFILSERTWKGQTVVRNIPVSDFHLKFDKYYFHLSSSPLRKNEIPAVQFEKDDDWFIAKEWKPQTKINPNKRIPAYIRILDKGSVRIIDESANAIRLEFNGSELKNHWVFLRTSPKSNIWSLVKSEQPKTYNLMCKDFSKLEQIKTSKDLKFPYVFKGVAFAEGTWHNEFYPWNVIRNSANKLVGAPLVIDHQDIGVLDTVGEVIKVIPNDNKKWLEFEGILFDTEKGKDVALLIENGKISGVSVRLTDAFKFNSEGRKEAEEILDWQHVSFVQEPEVSVAKILKNGQTCS